MTLGDLGEFGFIDRARRWLGDRIDPHGHDDDAAVVDAGGERLVATVDALVEGRHFRFDWSRPSDVGWKAVVANVSDVAAMGGTPRWLLLALGAPGETPIDVLEGIYEGMREACEAYDVVFVNGDTTRATEIVLSITALGTVDGEPLRRSGARPGDVIAVTGPLGRAACGVNLLMSGETSGLDVDAALACLDAHRRPRARVDAGRRLRAAPGIHAGMDLSDGLLSDVRRLAEASHIGIEVDADAVPVAPEVRSVSDTRGWDAWQVAASGGDDHELLVSMAPGTTVDGVELIELGRVVDEGLHLLRDGAREPLPEGGWDHFR